MRLKVFVVYHVGLPVSTWPHCVFKCLLMFAYTLCLLACVEMCVLMTSNVFFEWPLMCVQRTSNVGPNVFTCSQGVTKGR